MGMDPAPACPSQSGFRTASRWLVLALVVSIASAVWGPPITQADSRGSQESSQAYKKKSKKKKKRKKDRGERADPARIVESFAVPYSCPNPATRWNMLMRFWPRTSAGEAASVPSAAELATDLAVSRGQYFIAWSDCIVDLAIDGARMDGTYAIDGDNGASAYAGSYDSVWDVFPGTSASFGSCGSTSYGVPQRIESPAEGCGSQPFAPNGVLLTHEWWHGAIDETLPALGVGRALPDNHATESYGYPPDYQGTADFYAEMFQGKLSPNGAMSGVSRAEWALGTNRSLAGDPCAELRDKLRKAKKGKPTNKRRLRKLRRKLKAAGC